MNSTNDADFANIGHGREDALAGADTKPRQQALWIASYPKSGNTWLRVFLHNLLGELRGRTEAHDINALHLLTGREFSKRRF